MTKRKQYARTFGQDLMRGEHVVGGGMSKAFNAQQWVNDKIDDGDIAGGMASRQSGTSIFDPVICELAYTWFTAKGAAILDPFAGGSVRGIVAAYLGRHYTGIDLRAEQIEANGIQAEAIVPDSIPQWIAGDSLEMSELLPDDEFYDFVFSCPPYADLEVYSDDPRDISTMDYEDFLHVYREIIQLSIARLRDDRFACFVVGDVRDRRGNYRDFVGDTVQAFRDAGCEYYNDAVLVTAVGSLPIRAGRQFQAGRKFGKTHQNVLVFVKGDGKRATTYCGPVVVDMSLLDSDNGGK